MTKEAREKISLINHHLYARGLIEQALVELEELSNHKSDYILSQLAILEILFWFGRMENQKSARKCLELLERLDVECLTPSEQEKVVTIKANSLDLVGEREDAKKLLLKKFEGNLSANFLLALSNMEESQESKIEFINKAFSSSGFSEMIYKDGSAQSAFDSLAFSEFSKTNKKTCDQEAKVSVIVPVFNSEKTVLTSLLSIANQTWKNLEVIVVNDCSSDQSEEIIYDMVNKDPRFRVIKTPQNNGCYFARNFGLQIATGDFVMTHDADDWSHPEKIEHQVLHLISNPNILGNLAECARVDNNLKFSCYGLAGRYLRPNASSFMFRRRPILDSVGYFDSVNFSGDTEYIFRIKHKFGNHSVATLPSSLLCFQRISENSLTNNNKFGYQGFRMGARNEYFESYKHYYDQTSDYYVPFPQTERKFPVSYPSCKPKSQLNWRNLDVLFVADFRNEDASRGWIVDELKLLKRIGLKVGVVQASFYQTDPKVKSFEISPEVRNLIDGENIQAVIYGEKIKASQTIIFNSEIFAYEQIYFPEIDTKNLLVIETKGGRSTHEVERIISNIKQHFDTGAIWFAKDKEIYSNIADLKSKFNFVLYRLSWEEYSSTSYLNRYSVELMKRKAGYFHEINREPSNDDNSIVFYRILGNDLLIRHSQGQTEENLSFILENESEFENCEKRWVLNRIADKQKEDRILNLLEKRKQKYFRLPFVEREFYDTPIDLSILPYPDYLESSDFKNLKFEIKERFIQALYRNKNKYLMNVNGARNMALKEGRNLARWIMVWDGNGFLMKNSFVEIKQCTKDLPNSQYIIVPMARAVETEKLNDNAFRPLAIDEPQIVFRNDSQLEFDENFSYGRRNKTELLNRIGVPGIWYTWDEDPWDQIGTEPSEEISFGVAGWVVRLSSGNIEQEVNAYERGVARNSAVIFTIEKHQKDLNLSNYLNL